MQQGEGKMETNQGYRTEFSISNIRNYFVSSVKNNIRQYTMILALLSIWLIFSFLTDFMFLTPRNLSNLFLQTVTIAIIGIGMVLVIVGGHIDLSVGSIAGFTGAIAAILQVHMGMGTIPTIILTIVAGIIIGVWQGYWIAYQGVPAFIVTLAGMMAFRGATIGVTNGATIGPMNDSFKLIGQGYLPQLFYLDAVFNDSSLLLTIFLIIAYIFFEVLRRKSRQRKNLQLFGCFFNYDFLYGDTLCCIYTTITHCHSFFYSK